MGKPSRGVIIAAFAAVYLVWGSTYLAIRYAIETFPPLLMAGLRFAIAGSMLYIWGRYDGGTAIGKAGWRAALISGTLLLVIGNGSVVIAEQWVPSGIAALLVATMPLWMALLEWLRPGGKRPGLQVIVGISLGLAGVVLLVGMDNMRSGGAVDVVGATLLVGAAISWSFGSLYTRSSPIATSQLLTSGMQMLAAGTVLLLVSLAAGEWRVFEPASVSIRSVLAVTYLIVFGSIIAFTAFSWLLKKTTSSRLATYAYVNPAVAVILGWAVAGEAITTRMLLAMAVIIAAVVVTTTARTEVPS